MPGDLLIVLSWTVCVLCLVPLTVLCFQLVIAFVPCRVRQGMRSGSHGVLIPAHNEAAGLARTLENIQPQLEESDRLVVIADNCTDATASVAAAHGAEVLERVDSIHRGKGFALQAGIEHLARSPPATVSIFDADCVSSHQTISNLIATVQATARPAQALYLMRPPREPGPEAYVSTFAFLIKNWVRLRALQLLKLPVLLTGTGMAFPWELIKDAPLASGEIVEDLALGLHFTRMGKGPVFCESARVWSELPNTADAAISQRTRWEHGYLQAILRDVRKLLWEGMTRRPVLLLVALDLMVPPLALLVLLSLLACAITFLAAIFTQTWLPFLVLCTAGALSALGITLAWWRFARDLVPAAAILSIPGYVLGKLAIYRRFVTQRQTEWVRTEREGEAEEPESSPPVR